MQLTGKIVHATKTEQITDSFKKRDLIIEIDGDTQYPQEIKVELHQDKTELITGMVKGDIVTVDVNLRGRSWENKEGVKQWFNTLAVWKITRNGTAASTPTPAPKPTPAPSPDSDIDDGLPF